MPKDQRGVIRSRSEPALNPNRLRDKSLAPSTSLAANPHDTDTFYDQAESADTSCKDSDVRCYGDEDASWISWFCNQKGNEFFWFNLCAYNSRINYILDDFNRSGLRNQVPFYDYALDLMLDIESSNDGLTDEEQNNLIESTTEMLYGLIHARYIVTNKGLSAMMSHPETPVAFRTVALYLRLPNLTVCNSVGEVQEL
ncbi:casein kinase II subunit beta-4 [Pyrus ussuriensis x Pyrus communis]|uniref:Casein kinase II subunit beta n=1 Tax=Pyrus ussuriensis x Pyrus communis TaxID=2448454 RepID=A0A5N5F088_9ROSA|nr:casein kinase II subunit beta-4 [Pyrus ussuriensis x Pyrus communis]